MHCLILAGGFATRLWPLTEKRSKPLLPLSGKPMLTHLVERVPAGIAITVSTNAAFAQDMRTWAKSVRPRNVDIYVEDAGHEDEKLGALGALSRWIRERGIAEDVLLLAGDNYIGFSLDRFIAAYAGQPLLAAHDIGSLEEAKRFGTVILGDRSGDRGRVTAFMEKPSTPTSTLVSTGCYVLPHDTLPVVVTYAQKHPDNVGGIFEEFLRQHIAVDAFIFSEIWRDIGSFHAYLETHDELLKGAHVIADSARIDEESACVGSVAIGENCSIERSRLKNCILFAGSTVRDCILEDCILDEGCMLQGVDLQGKMLRRGTVLNHR